MKNNQIVVYDSGEVELLLQLKDETVWVTQKQISELFTKDIRTINDHIKAIYREEELHKGSTIRKFRIVQKEGNREVNRDVLHYNLDVIISVGYRTNSIKATKFRQWATKVLKSYISNGYAINGEKITVDRFINIEKDVNNLKQNIQNINNAITSSQIAIKQGIFHDGQIYDAYVFVNDLFRSAKKEVVLIDNYVDDTVLTLLSKYPKLNFVIMTKSISKQLKLDSEKYTQQYDNLVIKTSTKFHDRFLLIDDKEAYHIGASLKDLGRKTFAFSKIDTTLLTGKINAK